MIYVPPELPEEDVKDVLATIEASVDADVFNDLMTYLDYLKWWMNRNKDKDEKLQQFKKDMKEAWEKHRFD